MGDYEMPGEESVGGTATQTTSGEERAGQRAIQRLIADVNTELQPNEELYYVQLVFNSGERTIHEKRHLLHEIENGLEVRSTDPPIRQLGSSDSTVHLLVVTGLSPNVIRKGIVPTLVDEVRLEELDPSEYDIEIDDTPSSETSDPSEFFEELQQEYTDNGEVDCGEPLEGEATDPTTVQFSDDEITFEELLSEPAENEQKDGTTPSNSEETNTETLTSRLVTELETGVADEDNIEALGETLQQAHTKRSLTVQVKSLQTQMSSFQAYIDALEEFLDEEGTAQELLEGLRADISEVQTTLEDTIDTQESLSERMSNLESTTANATEVETELERLDEMLETMENQTNHELEQLISQLDSIEARLEEQLQWRNELRSVFLESADTHDGDNL
ncbi:hypothetical protein ACLI4U_13630 [Natrialbaceae archaeon A-CW2]